MDKFTKTFYDCEAHILPLDISTWFGIILVPTMNIWIAVSYNKKFYKIYLMQ